MFDVRAKKLIFPTVTSPTTYGMGSWELLPSHLGNDSTNRNNDIKMMIMANVYQEFTICQKSVI